MTKLRSATSNVGGWDVALVEAEAQGGNEPGSRTTPEVITSPSMTPLPDGTQRSFIDGDVAIALRNRLLEKKVSSNGSSSGHSSGSESPEKQDTKPAYSVLVRHPNEEVAALAEELVEMDSELTSRGPNKMRWPDNINLKSFAEYMLIPTLVYELEYPRTDR